MLDSLFKPKSVAIIGASVKELSIGNRILKNLLEFGFKGAIYPINPQADKVQGVRAYKSILDAPDGIDLVHIIIPGKFVPQAVEDCGKKGVKSIIINSAGFRETGPEGEAIEKDFLSRAKKYGIRIFGPNCQGIINTDPDVRAYCNFTFTKPESGCISIAAQSGGVGELIHQGFSEMGIGTRIYASNGNACDISIPEIIKYFGKDPGTHVVVLYIESISNPKEFIEAARELADRKPVLAMKAGRTGEGAKAVSSHTGALAGKDITTDLIFEKAGVLVFKDEGELCRAAAAFALQPIPKSNRVGIITNTGGPAIIATDVLIDSGLEIPQLSEKAKEALKDQLYPEACVNNPIDVLATGKSEHFRAAIESLMNQDRIDSLFINFVTPFFVDTDSIAKEIANAGRQKKKPIICNLMTDKSHWTETIRILKDGGIPCYSFPSDAAKALASLVHYARLEPAEHDKISLFPNTDKKSVELIINKARESGKSFLSANDVYSILEAYEITTVPWEIADSPDKAVYAAEEIGFPVVVKADSESIIHKSDFGFVALNLKDADEVKACAEDMRKRLASDDLNFLVQKYLPGGSEVIVGAKAEKGIGHIIMFGIGGIYVEVLKDLVFKIAPISHKKAREMINGIKGAKTLKGLRGKESVYEDGIIEIICKISQLVTDFPAIKEIDLNPLIAFSNRVFVADARITI
ncbi:MAG: CoA-binding protein [Desulfobacterium sp.]|nr:CoA-binding protein [Desulfobacterium sp.]MBU3946875.1 acetate--CoA ligase family protein [Pseudomonadota bacterium]MBU4036995.1 acetate--CoA ligase family protein [Pseudomonadota bacterium]